MEQRQTLWEQLRTVDQSIWFIVAIIAGVFLSLNATAVQGDALCAAIGGRAGSAPQVYPLRHTANSLVIGALGFFLCLAIRTWNEAGRGDPVAARSANANLWAAMLVLAAAMIRYDDVEFSHANGRL